MLTEEGTTFHERTLRVLADLDTPGRRAIGLSSTDAVALADIDAPTEHTCFPVEDGLVDERGIEIECKTVPCPSDCKSILFGDPCVICLECTFKVSLLSGTQKN